MSYKKLGEYIQQVNERNRDLETTVLLGVSITKKLIPSIANTIGTDMSVYKIIKRRQFAYGTVTSRNGEKISIALADEYEKALVSQIYVVFEVVDTTFLLPEYLMMWFSRPEFDRYARYHSHGSTRETFDWADLCETELPIPSIEEQIELVKQYYTISDKIKVNEQICEKLETTAQTLYKHWFVDFEFPNEEGKPYKSSGGKMVFNEELAKEIPEQFRVNTLGEISEFISRGITPKYIDNTNSCIILNQRCIRNNKIDYSFSKRHDFVNKKVIASKYICKNDVLINSTGDGTLGRTAFLKEYLPSTTVDSHITILRFKNPYKLSGAIDISLREEQITNLAEGSTGQTELSKEKLKHLLILFSDNMDLYKKFDCLVNDIFKNVLKYEKETPTLIKLQSLLLSRLAAL